MLLIASKETGNHWHGTGCLLKVDGLGIPLAGGGLSDGLRDLARFGELIRNKGNWHGEQIFPAAGLDIEKGGSKIAFAKSRTRSQATVTTIGLHCLPMLPLLSI